MNPHPANAHEARNDREPPMGPHEAGAEALLHRLEQLAASLAIQTGQTPPDEAALRAALDQLDAAAPDTLAVTAHGAALARAGAAAATRVLADAAADLPACAALIHEVADQVAQLVRACAAGRDVPPPQALLDDLAAIAGDPALANPADAAAHPPAPTPTPVDPPAEPQPSQAADVKAPAPSSDAREVADDPSASDVGNVGIVGDAGDVPADAAAATDAAFGLSMTFPPESPERREAVDTPTPAPAEHDGFVETLAQAELEAPASIESSPAADGLAAAPASESSDAVVSSGAAPGPDAVVTPAEPDAPASEAPQAPAIPATVPDDVPAGANEPSPTAPPRDLPALMAELSAVAAQMRAGLASAEEAFAPVADGIAATPASPPADGAALTSMPPEAAPGPTVGPDASRFGAMMTFPPESGERTPPAGVAAPEPPGTDAPAADQPAGVELADSGSADAPPVAEVALGPAPQPEPSPGLNASPEPAAEPALSTAAEPPPEAAPGLPGSEPPQTPPDAVGFSGELTPEQMAALMGGDAGAPGADGVASAWGSTPITLPPEKLELLQFMVADAKASLDQLTTIIPQLADFASREDAAAAIRDVNAGVTKVADFFAFESLQTLTGLLSSVADGVLTVPEELMPELLVRVRAIHNLFDQHVRGLEVGMEMRWPLDTLGERIRALLAGQPLDRAICGWHRGEPERLLELDAVVESLERVPQPGDPVSDGAADAGQTPQGAAATAAPAAADAEKSAAMVRVPAAALDALLEMISQLVLTKNRVVSLARELREPARRERTIEDVNAAADDLAMLSAGLQATMMKARMQPIVKLFERYPRVVSDLAGLADKKVALRFSGEQTMVDKNVFDGLADPLGQLLRAVVTQSMLTPDQRTLAGRSETGDILLQAENQGSHVMVSLLHDGVAMTRDAILARAVERGMLDAEQADKLPDDQAFALPFDDAFGEPNLAKAAAGLRAFKGRIDLRLDPDGRTRFDLCIPLTVAIIPAIMVGLGPEIYAVPLQSVEEIVKIERQAVSTVRSRPVLRLREAVLPLLDLGALMDVKPVSDPAEPPAHLGPADAPGPVADGPRRDDAPATRAAAALAPVTNSAADACAARFGVVIASGVERAALVVDRIVGKQEVVIKKLDDDLARAELFVGATIRDDGQISLILETAQIIRAGAA